MRDQQTRLEDQLEMDRTTVKAALSRVEEATKEASRAVGGVDTSAASRAGAGEGGDTEDRGGMSGGNTNAASTTAAPVALRSPQWQQHQQQQPQQQQQLQQQQQQQQPSPLQPVPYTPAQPIPAVNSTPQQPHTRYIPPPPAGPGQYPEATVFTGIQPPPQPQQQLLPPQPYHQHLGTYGASPQRQGYEPPRPQGGGALVPVEQVVEDLARMGFNRDLARMEATRLVDSGQPMDVNVIIDRLSR